MHCFAITGLLLVMATLPGVDGGGAAADSKLKERLSSVSTFLRGEIERQRIPGLSAAVVVDDELVWAEGFGLADMENSVPALANTVYRVGSISKSITAVGIMKLIRAGKLSLDASARDWVPEYPDKKEKITIRHLLGHLSGVREYNSREEYYNREHYDGLLSSLEVFKNDPLRAKPGERFIYSTYGYSLLGIVAERISGVPFNEFIDREVLGPLGMTSSGIENLEAIVPHRASGYVLSESGELKNSTFVDLSIRAPGDGMVSTVEDLARFAVAINMRSILTPELIEQMTAVQTTSAGVAIPYGLGFFVREEGGRRIIGHGSGGHPQASAFLVMYPDQHVAVAVIANLEFVDMSRIGLAMGAYGARRGSGSVRNPLCICPCRYIDTVGSPASRRS